MSSPVSACIADLSVVIDLYMELSCHHAISGHARQSQVTQGNLGTVYACFM